MVKVSNWFIINLKEEPKQEEGEENKPKMNIYDYQWTKSDGKPKNAAQIYKQLKLPEIVLYLYNYDEAIIRSL